RAQVGALRRDPRRSGQQRRAGRVRPGAVRARAGLMPLQRVLIANRGEAAVRLVRACHDLGIEAVAIYSTADRDGLWVDLADRAVCVGPHPPAESYLRVPSLIAAAETTGCDAVHPGWGFL